MSFNRIGLIIIAVGIIFIIGSITRQMNLDQEVERAESMQLAAEKLAQERLAAERLAQEQKLTQEQLAAAQQEQERLLAEKLAQGRMVTEKLAQDQLLAEKLAKDRLAAERWQAAAEIARQANPDLQVQTMIDPKQMVLVSTAKKKSRLSPKTAWTLLQKVRDQMVEGAAVKLLDATGKEIAHTE